MDWHTSCAWIYWRGFTQGYGVLAGADQRIAIRGGDQVDRSSNDASTNAGVHLAIVFPRSCVKLSWESVSYCLDLRMEKSAPPPLADVYSVMTSGEMMVSSALLERSVPKSVLLITALTRSYKCPSLSLPTSYHALGKTEPHASSCCSDPNGSHGGRPKESSCEPTTVSEGCQSHLEGSSVKRDKIS